MMAEIGFKIIQMMIMVALVALMAVALVRRVQMKRN